MRIIRAAEIEKLGASTALGAVGGPKRDSSAARASSSRPVVPETRWTPWATHQPAVAGTATAALKSTSTSIPPSSSSSEPALRGPDPGRRRRGAGRRAPPARGRDRRRRRRRRWRPSAPPPRSPRPGSAPRCRRRSPPAAGGGVPGLALGVLGGAVDDPHRADRLGAEPARAGPAGGDGVEREGEAVGGGLVVDPPAAEVRPGLLRAALDGEADGGEALPAFE